MISGGDVYKIIERLTGKPATSVRRWANQAVASTVASRAETRGRLSAILPRHLTYIREFLLTQSKTGNPTQCKSVCAYLLKSIPEEERISVSRETVRKIIKRMKFTWGKGCRRNMLAERERQVVWRQQYCQLKALNRRPGPLIVPMLPEIYLDESYVELGPTNATTWVHKNVPFMVRSRASKLIVVAAGIIYEGNDKVNAEFVEGSRRMWNPKRAGRRSTRTYSMMEEGDPLPAFSEDYHGNMNATNFERWFERLCETAKRKYGTCNIYMDGCSSHKRCINPQPTKNSSRRAILQALSKVDAPLTYDETQSKTVLYEIFLPHKEAKRYATQEIAKKHQHHLFFTPPYHPELQPIEKIWGVVKNAISKRTFQNIAELEMAVEQVFMENVTEDTWIGSWKKTLRYEETYLQNFETDEVAEDSDSTEPSTQESSSDQSEQEDE